MIDNMEVLAGLQVYTQKKLSQLIWNPGWGREKQRSALCRVCSHRSTTCFFSAYSVENGTSIRSGFQSAHVTIAIIHKGGKDRSTSKKPRAAIDWLQVRISLSVASFSITLLVWLWTIMESRALATSSKGSKIHLCFLVKSSQLVPRKQCLGCLTSNLRGGASIRSCTSCFPLNQLVPWKSVSCMGLGRSTYTINS